VKDALYIVGGAAIVVFFIVRQLRSDRFRERSLIFPLALGIYGALVLRGAARAHPFTAASVALLSLSALASIAFGVFRGHTIELFERGGELWERATWRTVAGWGGLLFSRIAIIALAAVVGARLAASPASIPLMIAVTLAAQFVVVSRRARESGIAIATSDRRSARRRARRRA